MRSELRCRARVRNWAARLLLAPALCAAPATADPVPEHAMKAAFIFNFAVFVGWPLEALPAGAPLRVCASPDSPIYGAIEQLNDKPVNGHRIALRQLPATPVRSCHMLVLAAQDRDDWPQWRHELSGASVLTVSDDRGISAGGAVIGLSSDYERIGFDVDMGAARAARLNLSSKLLRLARSVR